MTAPVLDPARTTPAPEPPEQHRDRYRPALAGLLVATGVLYLWGLGESGWANSFYSAAAQAGSESWKALFFGSSDAANSITVDKTPLALWPMALSVKVFGLSSWSILVPQAIEGVLAVWLLTATVRRTTGAAWAGLLAGAVLALTPVAVLMFRFDNPDAMLVLLMVGAAYAVLRAVEDGVRHPVRWMALAGALVGLGFLTKMLQVFLVLPAFGLVYLVAGHPRVRTRIGHLLVAVGTMTAAAGWWIAVVSLWPAASRPYIGGSQGNSILELTLGYNGFGRLNGDETGSVGGGIGGGIGGGGRWGETGVGRLVSSEVGGQVAWLLPAAVVLLAAGLWFTARRPRTDGVRAALILWGGWLLVTGLTFSFMAGIFHAYYTVALAPALAALVGIGAHQVWQQRRSWEAGPIAAVAVVLTAVTAFLLLGRSADFLPWLRWSVLAGGLLAAAALTGLRRLPRRLALAAAVLALAASLAGPAAYAVQTAGTAHTGSIPSAGPPVTGGQGGPGGRGGFGGPPGAAGQAPPGLTRGQLPQGGPGGAGAGGPGGAGGLLDASEPSAELTELLQDDADSYTWVAAAVGSNSASGYQLATEEPVMAIGGFNGSDPSPTLAEFQHYVEDGRIHYFIGGSGLGRSMGGSSASSEIAAWVEATYTATTVDGVTLYDLTSAS
ncbi:MULTISPECIES: glycosyltransferase family 39 protein [unclassified Nocardioides]|uniref:glycosyltransferase family 39 protein n=1 Tax=unclassified Nocardioides TaxID=2615069 RepID=UPI0009F13000|nr:MULTISPECIES: glycosyltransferase family 39 protein [unclassified Nocardioides]GAW48086.1 Putative Glycosyl transferase [Nocardioides sp. PD653-B2]GAW53611.1 putative Glycosyl transferase [Nocardioides sp. PD653]